MQTDLGPSVVVEIRCLLSQDKLPWFPAVTHMTLHGDKQHGIDRVSSRFHTGSHLGTWRMLG